MGGSSLSWLILETQWQSGVSEYRFWLFHYCGIESVRLRNLTPELFGKTSFSQEARPIETEKYIKNVEINDNLEKLWKTRAVHLSRYEKILSKIIDPSNRCGSINW